MRTARELLRPPSPMLSPLILESNLPGDGITATWSPGSPESHPAPPLSLLSWRRGPSSSPGPLSVLTPPGAAGEPVSWASAAEGVGAGGRHRSGGSEVHSPWEMNAPRCLGGRGCQSPWRCRLWVEVGRQGGASGCWGQAQSPPLASRGFSFPHPDLASAPLSLHEPWRGGHCGSRDAAR